MAQRLGKTLLQLASDISRDAMPHCGTLSGSTYERLCNQFGIELKVVPDEDRHGWRPLLSYVANGHWVLEVPILRIAKHRTAMLTSYVLRAFGDKCLEMDGIMCPAQRNLIARDFDDLVRFGHHGQFLFWLERCHSSLWEIHEKGDIPISMIGGYLAKVARGVDFVTCYSAFSRTDHHFSRVSVMKKCGMPSRLTESIEAIAKHSDELPLHILTAAEDAQSAVVSKLVASYKSDDGENASVVDVLKTVAWRVGSNSEVKIPVL